MGEACERRGRIFGGCHFEARYSVSEPIFDPKLRSITGMDVNDFRRRTYIGDVCTSCGRYVSPRTPKIEESAK